MRFLIIGQGGREHALLEALTTSGHATACLIDSKADTIMRETASHCLECDTSDPASIAVAAHHHKITHAVIGPEDPLVHGWADTLREAGLAVVGPGKAGARLEGSKIWMKHFVQRHKIPTAAFYACHTLEEARSALAKCHLPIVVKADGLAAGKGVIIAQTRQAAEEAIHECMVERRFNNAGASLLLEEYLSGHEVSYFVLSDGTTALPFGAARDHKRLLDNDRGPNTGGMGCISWPNLLRFEDEQHIQEKIVRPLIAGLKKEQIPYSGVLFFGLMLTEEGPKLLEINCRFGDPECQTLLLRLDSDLGAIFDACAHGRLSTLPKLRWRNEAAVTLTIARQGYPVHKPSTPSLLENLQSLVSQDEPHVKAWHCNITRDAQHRWQAHTGRVLTIGARAKTIEHARNKAIEKAEQLQWSDGYYRRDIGMNCETSDA